MNRLAPDIFSPMLPTARTPNITWGGLEGAARGLGLSQAAHAHPGLMLVVTPDTQSAAQLEQETRFFSDDKITTLVFPDWETLPYDLFSPHEDIISQRLETLYRLPSVKQGMLIVPVTTLLQRLAPRTYLDAYSLMLEHNQALDREGLRTRLEQAGYQAVSQVMAHGEYALRGAIIDLFPMGSRVPYRIELIDEDIESLREFDPESQVSRREVERIRLLPAREFPRDEAAIKRFRQTFRATFTGDPSASLIYREVSQGNLPAGIEYYLPLFFAKTQALFDYLPDNTLVAHTGDTLAAAETFLQQVKERHARRQLDSERPPLAPEALYLSGPELTARLPSGIHLQGPEEATGLAFNTLALPEVNLELRAPEPAQALKAFLAQSKARALFVAESPGRRETLLNTLQGVDLHPAPVAGWSAFVTGHNALAITTGRIDQGMLIEGHTHRPALAVLTEHALMGGKAPQQRRRRARTRDAEAIIRNLYDLHEGTPVVHEEHGVGRYRGLVRLTVGGMEAEFLQLEYAGGDKLYVPVAKLDLISRYTGASSEHAPLHRLGGEQWARIKQKAKAKAYDVAAELLEIHARRAARTGFALTLDDRDYSAFSAAFPFEETPDQQRVIDEVLADLAASRPMDRVVCGDVGFGKTEVALRAAFVAVQNDRQVAVLVPTTLLAQQHHQTFSDRFADWPVKLEALSRLQGAKQQQATLKALAQGQVDIIIGTHRLLGSDIKFKNLGLIIVDEEHRFGVRHKERLKALRAEVDILTLTATPIPRTLNMALSGLRDLSVIATPPLNRHAIKTFVGEWDEGLIREAGLREIKRGGQVYFIHNEIKTIDKMARQAQAFIPQAKVRIAHGQMHERELEQVMLDFYHQRFNLLVCTTIIESGIDVPNANTIIIHRADHLGLAQLHQLRGRVGRSHHRAYAYLLTPPKAVMTADARARLDAISALEDLGIGFTLATHDLEIRGTGELLGEEQSGQIEEIGFTLYNELLERAVKALKAGHLPEAEDEPARSIEVSLGAAALLPDTYIPDVALRLILYKRIANADSFEALRELQVELIDRFGLLPEQARNLFETAHLKLSIAPLGITRVEVGAEGGRLCFGSSPRLDTRKLVALIQRQPQAFRLDGTDTLRFIQPLETVEARVKAVMGILDLLALRQAA